MCYTVLRGGRAMANRNITLSLPEEDLQRAQIIHIRRGRSLSELLTRMIKELADQETGYAGARARSLARLEQGRNLGTEGRVRWSRDELHERYPQLRGHQYPGVRARRDRRRE